MQLTIDLYARIIINCSVGAGYSQKKVRFEKEDGLVVEISIQESIDQANLFAMSRGTLALNILVPEMLPYAV